MEARPSELPPFLNPFHVAAIASMGLTLGEIFFLEDLVADCAADGRYWFLLVVAAAARDPGRRHADQPYALKYAASADVRRRDAA